MVDEKKFDHENYIQERLREIDDLDERRYARELLTEGLGRIFKWAESKYDALEERVQRELDAPWRAFHVFTTIIDREDYDPISDFWFPVCEEDVEPDHGQRGYETVYLEADDTACREFLNLGTITVEDTAAGELVRFRIQRPARYLEHIKKLYTLFEENHVPWQTIHMGHFERFFDLVPEEEGSGNAAAPGHRTEYRFQDTRWASCLRQGMVPVWNIRKLPVHSREYRIPCIDEVFHEHVFYLPEKKEDQDGYLAETGEEIVSVRYEKNKMILKTRREVLEDITVFRVCQGGAGSSGKCRYPVLSNDRKDDLAARYLQQTGNFIQTPAELIRKIQELADGYEIEVLGYEFLDASEDGFLEGDMNSFVEGVVSGNDMRKIFLIHIQKKRQYQDDYLYESQIRYILSQLQMEFLEYRCMGR